MKVMDVLKGLFGGSPAKGTKGSAPKSKSALSSKASKKKAPSKGSKAKMENKTSVSKGRTSSPWGTPKGKGNIKRIAKNEFRYNNSTKHPNYIFEEEGSRYHSLGLTHHSNTKDKKEKLHKNMPLKNNPDKNDSRAAYIRYGVITDKKKNYSERTIKRLKFSEDDFSLVKSKVRNYKKGRKKRKRKKTND